VETAEHARLEADALAYHAGPRPGKLAIAITKPCATQLDLCLAYTPGVAEPVRRIHADPALAYRYTAKGNLVAVISNGTAVLGLGNVGALAGKPVMEGKALLFKRFADVDVFDLEIDAQDPGDIVRIVKALEPTFGGINLEDIKAPDCFVVEERLKAIMSIPVFHDDQHGTAIVTGAALLNALEITGRTTTQPRIVISGAGAAAIASAQLFCSLGVPRDNIVLVDTRGVVHVDRVDGMNPYKRLFATRSRVRTLEEALAAADVFMGLSAAGIVTRRMVSTMARRPIIFAMANPDPEISYDDARAARPDAIVATGRSDTPNQVNNVLAFPGVFRGALDVRARTITNEMKMAAARALAALAKEPVPPHVLQAHRVDALAFGPGYLLPKPLDARVPVRVAAAVAAAAVRAGINGADVDLTGYAEALERRLGYSR
jgi:malate dehydrogenase (oxaloacetate-decarboxylating)(NADP+)